MSDRIEQLRQEAMAKWTQNEFEASIPIFDQALALATDDETRELLTINKSFAVISIGQTSSEVQALPQIIMRRRKSAHVLLAAYYLQVKNRMEGDYRRAQSYLRVAMQAAEDAGDGRWKSELLIELGQLCVYDSRTAEAIEHFEAALAMIDSHPGHVLRRPMCVQNIGYCKLLLEDFRTGIDLILQAIVLMKEAGGDGYLAESYIDLCFGYLGLEELEQARHFGELGFSLAKDLRQIRNAHYLLGEVAYKSGDQQRAESHFEQLAKFYPDFPHLKDLLLAIDLRAMVNLKL